jgi:hypothetical protein
MLPGRERFKQQVTLLSRGFSCPEAFPDGKVWVYPWDSAVDEWVLRHQKEASGKDFMWKIIPQICGLNGCPIEKFVVGDVTTVLLISRAIRHQNKISYTPTCPNCRRQNKEEMIIVPDDLERVGEKAPDYPGHDVVTLPVCGDVVRLRPLLVGDMTVINARSAEQRNLISDRLAHVLAGIVDVNGGAPESLSEVMTWWQALHASDQAFLSEAVDKLTPHLSSEIRHVCDHCQAEFRHPLPLDQEDFFRNGGRTGTPGPLEKAV